MGRCCPTCQPSSRIGENPPCGMIGRVEETSASFEARSAPRLYPTAEGVAGLWRDKTRPSRIPPLDPTIAERVVSLTLAGPPPDATHWTGAGMAEAIGISVSSVQRIWRAHGLQPHRVRQFIGVARIPRRFRL